MSQLTLVWKVLLVSGIFLVDIYAQISSTSESTGVSNTTKPVSSNTSTQAPSNATTHAPSNATTHAPSNATTHAPSNTTTHAPYNTTTHAPSNTTTHITQTTEKPTPTLAPVPSQPESGNYTVKDANKTCIIAKMGLELQLENSTKKSYFNIAPKQTNYNGTCGDSKANLLLTFPEGSINFVFIKESKVYYIYEVSVNFSLASAGHWEGIASNLKLLSTDIGYCVKCKNTPSVKLGNNSQLILSDVKLQAFNIHNGLFGTETVCYTDRTKTLIPVGVALAIVGLILITLLVLLLARRRRMPGYEQI